MVNSQDINRAAMSSERAVMPQLAAHELFGDLDLRLACTTTGLRSMPEDATSLSVS
jgi:hypothetical protein